MLGAVLSIDGRSHISVKMWEQEGNLTAVKSSLFTVKTHTRT